MEAEYTAPSMVLRVAIPLMDISRYDISGFESTKSSIVTFKTTIHEDSVGDSGWPTLSLAGTHHNPSTML